MGVTTSSDLSPKVQAAYDKRFLLIATPRLALYQLGQKKKLEQGKGKTVIFTRYAPLAKRKTALTETANGGVTEGKKLQTQEISCSVEEYGDYVEVSHIASLTSIDPNVKEKISLVSQQASETIESLISDVVGVGFLRRRADADTDYQKDVAATDDGTTTTIICSGLGAVNDVWNGGFVTFTDPTDPNYGITVKVTDYVGATTTLTVDALPNIVESGSKFRIVVGTGLASADVLSSAVIRLAKRDLKRMKCLPMEDGKYVGVLDPDVEYDFMSDTDWKAVATYQNAKALYAGEIGEWHGIRFVEATESYRESVAGVASETGAVHVIPILGREAFGVVDLSGDEKKIIVKTPQQTGQPLELTGTVGWKAGFKTKVLNSCYGVNLLCGATA